MSNKMKLLVVGIVMGFSWQASAANIWWNGSVDHSWINPLNWDTGAVPGTADIVYTDKLFADRPIIEAGVDEAVNTVLIGAFGGNPAAMEMTGGRLTVSASFNVNRGATAIGQFDMSGGTLTVGGSFTVGLNDDPSLFTMTGGLIDTKYVAMGDLAEVVLSNGTVDVNTDWTMDAGASVDIYDGTIIVRNTSKESQLQGYIDSGLIIAHGGAKTVGMVNNGTTLTITTYVDLAENYNWTNGGGDHSWTNSTNWDLATVPSTNDTVIIGQVYTNRPIIETGVDETVFAVLIGSWTAEFAALEMTGGSLTVSTSFNVNRGSAAIGKFDMSGGTLTVDGSFTVGLNDDPSLFTMTGGLIDTKYVAMGDQAVAVLSNGTVDVLWNWTMDAGASVDIYDGTIIVRKIANESVIQGYIDSGLIIAHGGAKTVSMVNNGTTLTITADLGLPGGFSWSDTDLRGDNFQSHNQKIVWTPNGLFRSGDQQTNAPSFDVNENVIVQRSTDGGTSWTTLFDTGIDRSVLPPVTVEADENANVYLIYPDNAASNTRFVKFSPTNNYALAVVNRAHSQATSGSKFSSFYDPDNQRLYHATQFGYLFTFDLDGNFVAGRQLFDKNEPEAGPSYPHLFVDESGGIHYALTTRDGGEDVPYETIRYLKSLDGGANWKAMDNTAVTLPTTCVSNGPSTMINLPGEENYITWLACMHVKNGKAHFVYQVRNPWLPENLGNPPVIANYMHYMRFDVATGVREIDRSPSWGGDALAVNNYSASFASDLSNPTGALYAVGLDGVYLNALVSYDNGSTWEDFARSGAFTEGYVANPGLYRQTTPDGAIVGCLATANPGWATVNFFTLESSSVASGYTAWAALYGLTGSDTNLTADVENGGIGDGLNNLLEYALGGNPTVDDAAAILPRGFMGNNTGTNWLYYVHNERTDDASLTYTVGTKTNLVTDASLNADDVSVAGESGAVDHIKSVTNRTEAAEAAKFIGLEVEKN